MACDCVSEGTARPKLAFATRRNASRPSDKAREAGAPQSSTATPVRARARAGSGQMYLISTGTWKAAKAKRFGIKKVWQKMRAAARIGAGLLSWLTRARLALQRQPSLRSHSHQRRPWQRGFPGASSLTSQRCRTRTLRKVRASAQLHQRARTGVPVLLALAAGTLQVRGGHPLGASWALATNPVSRAGAAKPSMLWALMVGACATRSGGPPSKVGAIAAKPGLPACRSPPIVGHRLTRGAGYLSGAWRPAACEHYGVKVAACEA